jgi:hypothetical protein
MTYFFHMLRSRQNAAKNLRVLYTIRRRGLKFRLPDATPRSRFMKNERLVDT